MYLIAIRLYSLTDIFTGEIQAYVVSADCKSEIIRDDVLIYTCDMTVQYTIQNQKYTRRIIVIGHTLYIPDRNINIQYDPNNPFDIRIKQTTTKEMSNTILMILICVFIVTLLEMLYGISKFIIN